MELEIRMYVSKVNINIPDKMSKVQSDKFGKYAAQTWKKFQDEYVPMQSGNLANNLVQIQPWAIWHNTPYAHYQYVGTNLNHKVAGQGHEKATAYWDRKAFEEQGEKFISAMQKYVNSGALGLGK